MIACTAIHVANRLLDSGLPEHLEWWKAFGVNFKQMETIANEVFWSNSIDATEYNHEWTQEVINRVTNKPKTTSKWGAEPEVDETKTTVATVEKMEVEQKTP